MTDRYRTALLFGPPGVGKGTQGRLLASVPGFSHLATGDIFRSLDATSELGREFLAYSTRGELVPDDITIRVWKAHAAARVTLGLYRPQSSLLLLDGIPRSGPQAEVMDNHIEVLAIIHLVCPDRDEMIRRMHQRAVRERRLDDADEAVIRRRFDVYDEETAPVLRHYHSQIVHEIDAMGTPAEVLHAILGVLAPVQARHFENPLA